MTQETKSFFIGNIFSKMQTYKNTQININDIIFLKVFIIIFYKKEGLLIMQTKFCLKHEKQESNY